MDGKEKEYQDMAEAADKDFEKVEAKAFKIEERALDGRITIIDKKELEDYYIVSAEILEQRLNDKLELIRNSEDFILFHIYLQNKIYKQNREKFEIYYPCNSPFSKKENGLFNIDVNIVDNVPAFLEKIIESKSDITSYYRGQGCWNFDMEPGIYRKNRKEILNHESYYIKEIISKYPHFFNECKSALDYLSVLQHNGFPTRLLDFTENPLVALYMACSSEEDGHADVIELKVSNEIIKYYDSDTVAILSNIAMIDDDICFDENQSKEELNKEAEKLICQIRNEKPYFKSEIEPRDLNRILFVKSKHNFERISRQSGLFALFGIKRSKLERPEIEKMDGIMGITHYIIPHSYKKIILSELDCMGINKASLYCDLGSVLDYYIKNIPNKDISERNKKREEESLKGPF